MGNLHDGHLSLINRAKKFAEFVGAKYCITCTSGTTALYLALKSVYDKSIPKKINIPDYAGIFVGNACIQAGISPVLRDVSKNGSLVSNDKPKFTFPHTEKIVIVEVSDARSPQSINQYCEKTRQDISRKGVVMNNFVSLSLLEKLK